MARDKKNSSEQKLVAIFITSSEEYRDAISAIFSKDPRLRSLSFCDSKEDIDPNEINQKHRIVDIGDIINLNSPEFKKHLEFKLGL